MRFIYNKRFISVVRKRKFISKPTVSQSVNHSVKVSCQNPDVDGSQSVVLFLSLHFCNVVHTSCLF